MLTTDPLTVTASPDGKVTVENDVCCWGLLELPSEAHRSPTGRVWVAPAVCRDKTGKYELRVVNLRLEAPDVLAIHMALGLA